MPSIFRNAYNVLREQGFNTFFQLFSSFVRQRLTRLVSKPVALVVRITAKIIPNNPELVLFSTRHGRLYEDNSRYLYEYILENEPNLNPMWITHEKEVYHNLSAKSHPVKYIYSIGGIWALCRASVGVTTHGKKSFSFSPNAVPDTISIILVGHGDPVKSTQRTPSEIEMAKKRLDEIESWVTTSDFTRNFRLEQYVRNDEEIDSLPDSLRDTFIPTGYPRSDILLNPSKEATKNWGGFVEELEPNLVVLYSPTKHYNINVEPGDPAVDFFPFDDFNQQELFDFLENHKILVLIRPHPSDVRTMHNALVGPFRVLSEELKQLCDLCEYVRMATHYEIADTTALLPFVDVLVTDYSSIYHDFLLLDRPILFVPYDYEKYESERGFTYDYYEYLPGPEITSFAQFVSEIFDILNNIDKHQSKRHLLRNLIHKHQDGNARERLTEHIRDICDISTT